VIADMVGVLLRTFAPGVSESDVWVAIHIVFQSLRLLLVSPICRKLEKVEHPLGVVGCIAAHG
jgi:hypothetical protein